MISMHKHLNVHVHVAIYYYFYVCVHVHMYSTLTTEFGLSTVLSGKAVFDSPDISAVSAVVAVPAGDGVVATGDYTR